jgi:hypothetical protein
MRSTTLSVKPGRIRFHIPPPGRPTHVEFKEILFTKAGEKLNDEEGIASGPLLHELCQGVRVRCLTAQGVADELCHVSKRERLEHDLVHDCFSFADRIQGANRRV